MCSNHIIITIPIPVDNLAIRTIIHSNTFPNITAMILITIILIWNAIPLVLSEDRTCHSLPSPPVPLHLPLPAHHSGLSLPVHPNPLFHYRSEIAAGISRAGLFSFLFAELGGWISMAPFSARELAGTHARNLANPRLVYFNRGERIASSVVEMPSSAL